MSAVEVTAHKLNETATYDDLMVSALDLVEKCINATIKPLLYKCIQEIDHEISIEASYHRKY